MDTLSVRRRAQLWALLATLGLIAATAMFAVPSAGAASGVPSGDGVQPVEIGGNPNCKTLLNADDYLFERKVEDPKDKTVPFSFNGLSGSVTIDVSKTNKGEVFDFSFSGDFVAAAVIVKGGPKANLYDYRPGGNDSDTSLHAPVNSANKKFYGLSHISFCIDDATIEFVCDEAQTLSGEGLITDVTAAIFANSLDECTDKEAVYRLVDDVVTLDFNGDSTAIASGRLDFVKDFADPALFVDLQYDGPGSFVDVQWCDIRDKSEGDGDQFDDVLEAAQYPSLVGVTDGEADATACKVFEGENAAGVQHTVVYFEFQDPNFR